jgi:hypothetical protein
MSKFAMLPPLHRYGFKKFSQFRYGVLQAERTQRLGQRPAQLEVPAPRGVILVQQARETGFVNLRAIGAARQFEVGCQRLFHLPAPPGAGQHQSL